MLLGKFVNLETGSYNEARLYLNSWLSSCLRLLIVGITGVYPRHPAWALLLNDIAKCSLVVCWSGVREDNYALSYRDLGVSALLSLLWPGKGDELGSWILPLIPVGFHSCFQMVASCPMCQALQGMAREITSQSNLEKLDRPQHHSIPEGSTIDHSSLPAESMKSTEPCLHRSFISDSAVTLFAVFGSSPLFFSTSL